MSRRNPLPRGIETFLSAEPGPQTPYSMDIGRLEPNPFQPRRELTGLEDLAASIKEHGVLQPILVRRHPEESSRYQVVAGERRWRAAQMVPLHAVPVTFCEMDDTAVAIAALVENLQREDLNAMDEAEGYARMIRDFGWTQEIVANAVGRSRSHVANTLRLLQLSGDAARAVRDGRLTAGHGRAILSHPDPASALRTILDRDLSVRQAERLPRDVAPTERQPDPDRDALAQRLMESLGLAVAIDGSGERGSVRIQFKTLDQLDGLIGLLMPG